MKRILVYEKGNGFLLSEQEDMGPDTEWIFERDMVVEGKDAKKIGEAVLSLFQKPRGPRKRPPLKAA